MSGRPETTLPEELERLLIVAAERASRRRRRRWPVALGSVVAVGAVAAAAAGVFYGEGSTVSTGETESGTYVVEVKSKQESPAGSLCLQMHVADARPAYGCGTAPTDANPFGLLIADSSAHGQLVFYGLVSSEVTRISVLGDGAQHFDAETAVKPGLPGRFFSLVTPAVDRIEAVGFDDAGDEVGRIGSREDPDHPPLSHDEAVAQGDLAGFAPTAVPVRHFTYRGELITPEEASSLGLVCAEGSERPPCYDNEEDAIADGN